MVMQSTQVWSATIGGLGHHAWEMPLDVFEKNMIVGLVVLFSPGSNPQVSSADGTGPGG